MERISLLLPTRQRPMELQRLAKSVRDTADNPESVEIVTYTDDDDPSYDGLRLDIDWLRVRGPREYDGIVNLSVLWNKCWSEATGEIFMHCGDDIVFRTAGWDTAVRKAINSKPGKIAFVWCNDLTDQSLKNNFGTHGFIHRNWTDAIGRFVPPYFASDFNDTWFNDVARELDVCVYLPDQISEHMHYSVLVRKPTFVQRANRKIRRMLGLSSAAPESKAGIDQNTRDRLARHDRQKPEDIYYSVEKRQERSREVEKLRELTQNRGWRGTTV